jgi:CRISPR-associated protein Cmr3
MLTTLYPVIGSLLQVGTCLELIKATDFYAKPVVYTGLVCESGAGKTPAQTTILKPLFALQNEAEIDYKERLQNYQQELSEWKKLKDTDEPAPEQPIPHEYYTTDATSEAVALIQSQQPDHGFLGWFDELPALFKSQGQYKNGRGADGEKILSGRDGTGFKVNRASGKRLVVNQSAYSITGALQPLILRQMMGDFTDANGQWARFLWTVMQVQPAPYPDDAIAFDVSGLLKGIYRRISKLAPQTYKLSPKAQKKYRNWYNKLDQLKMSESRQGLRAVYSKMKGDTGVLALLLHCFNGCVLEGSVPNPEVSEQTMAAAIKLAKYHIGQVKLIHSEGDVANGDIAAIHAKIIQLSERKGWLKAADVRDIDRQTKKQFTADDIRRHFQELEASGFGQTKGEGTRLMWSIYKDSPPEGNPSKLRTNSGQTQDKPESTTDISVQPLIGKILDKTQDNSGQTQDSQSEAGSVSNISVQALLSKTQDTQDTFEPANTKMDVSVAQKQIKSDVLSFSVLSCPEFVSESCDSITVGVSTQGETQDSCPETALSCPEQQKAEVPPVALAPATTATTKSELPIYQRSDGGFEVETPSPLEGWDEAIAHCPYPEGIDLEVAKAHCLAMRDVFVEGGLNDYQDLYKVYDEEEITWVCTWLKDYQPMLYRRIQEVSVVEEW